MAHIDGFLQLARAQGASDVHFTVGRPPLVRLDGELVELQYRALAAAEIEGFLLELLDDAGRGQLEQRGAVDLSYATPELGRFRLNVFRQRLGMAAICRVIPEQLPRLADLGLPRVVGELSVLDSGLVLISGGPGTGKTTTLAALVDEINRQRNCNIITIEDPIEFAHESQKSLVLQREVGTHVPSFSDGIRSSLRQDPDVLLIGELRDPEAIVAAIEAAETGHLVFGTLNTRGAYQAIHRIVDTFPTDGQAQIRHTLAETLRAVVSQDLVRMADGRGRRVVAEIMIMTSAIAQLVRENKMHQVASAIGTGRRLGMQLMDQALLSLVQSGEIDPDDAFLKALDKKEFAPFVTRPELLAALDRGPRPGAAEAA
ncbi:MAG: PilT/PilU family type 4a pilus ATPase [Candidatus Eisenbacteria bacterium]